ncbi:MAG: DUF4124 domain-containing protein [Bdellovibrionales bacterium]|nr:DUF4124 domain-containing protein [Bdellovibrionales bacterium]
MKYLICTFVIFFISFSAYADDVYKWVDELGVTHYSSSPNNENAKVAKLPEISRGDVPVPGKLLKTCKKHGGIDCAAGADKDGSVICYDGFKEAAARFTMSCSSPKLLISDVSKVQADGTFTVFVRNSRSVAAEGTKVFFKNSGQEHPMLGPSEIDAFGVAEYLWKDDPGIPILDQPKAQNIRIACSNCDG